jgi:hypothetical protein
MIALLILPIVGGLVSFFLHWKFRNKDAMRVSERWIKEHVAFYDDEK